MESSKYIILTFTYHKQKSGWSGYCEELGTAVDGKSLQEAEALLKEFVELHLQSLEDIGEQESFLKQHKIMLHHAKPKGKVTVSVTVNKEVFTSPYVHELPKLVVN